MSLTTSDSHFLSELMERVLASRSKHPVGPPPFSAILFYAQAVAAHQEAQDLDGLREAALSLAAMALRVGVESGKSAGTITQ